MPFFKIAQRFSRLLERVKAIDDRDDFARLKQFSDHQQVLFWRGRDPLKTNLLALSPGQQGSKEEVREQA